MNTTTSLDRDQILNLCELIHTSRSGNLPSAGSRVLGLFRCIQVTVLILRHNLTQELLADIHTVSQATISRVVAVYTPLIAEALQNSGPRQSRGVWGVARCDGGVGPVDSGMMRVPTHLVITEKSRGPTRVLIIPHHACLRPVAAGCVRHHR